MGAVPKFLKCKYSPNNGAGRAAEQVHQFGYTLGKLPVAGGEFQNSFPSEKAILAKLAHISLAAISGNDVVGCPFQHGFDMCRQFLFINGLFDVIIGGGLGALRYFGRQRLRCRKNAGQLLKTLLTEFGHPKAFQNHYLQPGHVALISCRASTPVLAKSIK